MFGYGQGRPENAGSHEELLAEAVALQHRGEYEAAAAAAHQASCSPSPIQRQAALLRLRDINRFRENHPPQTDPRRLLGGVPLTPELYFLWSYSSLKAARAAWDQVRCRDLLEFLWHLAETTGNSALRLQALIELGLHARQWPGELQNFVQPLVPTFDAQLRHSEGLSTDDRLHLKAVHGRGLLNSSIEMIEHCQEGFGGIRDKLGVADTFLTRATLYARQGKRREVHSCLQDAKAIVGGLGLATDQVRADWQLRLYDELGILVEGFIGRKTIEAGYEVCEVFVDLNELPDWLRENPDVLPLNTAVCGGAARLVAKQMLHSASSRVVAERKHVKDVDLISEVLEFETKHEIREQLRRVELCIALDVQQQQFGEFFRTRDFRCNELLIVRGQRGYRLLATEDALHDLRHGIGRPSEAMSSLPYLPARIIARGLRHFSQGKLDDLVIVGEKFDLRKVQRYLLVLSKELQDHPGSHSRFIHKCQSLGLLDDEEIDGLRSRFPVFAVLVKWLPTKAACFLADLQDKETWAWRLRWLKHRR